MWTLKISKDRHKFSSSHFTIFSKENAEALHGHNYYVSLEVEGDSLNEQELLIDVVSIKKSLSSVLESWDEKILLPKNSPYLILTGSGDSINVKYSNRAYSFPSAEVELLDITNVTMESLAKLISDKLLSSLKPMSYKVSVRESQGQEASFYRKV